MRLERAVNSFVQAARHNQTRQAAAILRGTLLLHSARRVTPDVFEDDEQYLQVVCASADDRFSR
ncbi:MAG: hypothetical protein A2289_26560 [Deltaproteobacteria bacterium RIFOXYA12_FULL_58_15]|nr:MAG: hypothetical protein A2289_26560 [Deltaproteobacteria bacterium RIFOXYA12_FULL_58_15]OGR07703.1 MAG: hypothetical protein A2341_06685 [Deltaproteobacteria bacterium RIFOXYB12_FULL_58_9]